MIGIVSSDIQLAVRNHLFMNASSNFELKYWNRK